MIDMNAPGSIPWLLRHEVRLAWYGAALNKGGKRRPGMRGLISLLIGWIILHCFAFALMYKTRGAALDDPAMAVIATVVIAICLSFMLSTALRASVMALFERGDLDLLLSSPLPSLSIFGVRLLGVVMATAAFYLYLLSPFANMAVAFGHPGWLGIYVAVCACAVLASCAAMLLTLALVRVLGARRTRVVAQVVAAIAGALLFLLTQAFNLVDHDAAKGAAPFLQRLGEQPVFALSSPLWWPGRAAFGAPLPLLAAILLAALAFALTLGRTHRFFVHGLQEAASSDRTPTRPAGQVPLRFRARLFDTIVLKEWRLIVRDPNLISQVLLQLLYLLPLLFLILRNGSVAPAIGTGLTLLCGSLTGGLAWIVISAEHAPDLLLASPAPRRTVRLAKLTAATLPPLALVTPPLLWLIVRTPLAGMLVALTSMGAVVTAGVIVLWTGRAAPRSDFKMRNKENLLCSMLELFNSMFWAGLGWVAVALVMPGAMDPYWLRFGAAVALAGCIGVPALAWLLRRRPV